MGGELLTVLQIADYLKLSEKTVYGLVSDKVAVRSWYIKESDIEAYLQAYSNGKKGIK